MAMKLSSSSAVNTRKFAQNFGGKIKKGKVIAFYGNLGAGKTQFVQGLAKGLGINKRIISPTFVILRSYEGKKLNLHHVDLYRLSSEKEIIDQGITQLFEDPKNIVAIEWAEKIEKLLPKDAVKVHLNYLGDNNREIIIDEN